MGNRGAILAAPPTETTAEAKPREYPWSIAIFSSREDPGTLWATLQAVVAASQARNTVIDVIVNGNPPLSERMVSSGQSLPLTNWTAFRVWHIGLPDKAHAWNVFVHRIWTGSAVAYFIDGYAQVAPDALRLLDEALNSAPEALGATGVPSYGRSANTLRARMIRSGGIHGNLHAIRGDALRSLRDRSFRLPLGLYRIDPVYGAVLNFGLDPARNTWDPRRILVVPTATWFVHASSPWRIKNLKNHWNRLLRQAKGWFENSAVRDHLAIRRQPPEDLPETAEDLILSWIERHPSWTAWLILKHPLCLLAAIQARQPRD